MKTVLLLVHADAGQEARLQAALDLTDDLEQYLADLTEEGYVPRLVFTRLHKGAAHQDGLTCGEEGRARSHTAVRHR